MLKSVGALLRQTEVRVVLVVLAGLLLVDGSLRLAQRHLSGNLAHVAQIPALLTEAGSAQERSLLLLGNSLVNDGVAAPALAQQLPYDRVGKITPDGTGLWDWQCLLDHQLLDRPEVQFDTVLIGFAWHLLSDQTRVDPSRLGSLFCELRDLSAPQRIGLGSSADIGEFLAAKALKLYALRETLRNRVLQLLVPHYEEFTQAANRAGGGESAEQDEVSGQVYSYTTFSELVERMRSDGTRVIIVAMPVQEGYQIDDNLRALPAQGLLDLIDLRQTPLGPQHYRDPMHLNPDGQRILTEALIQALQAQLADAP